MTRLLGLGLRGGLVAMIDTPLPEIPPAIHDDTQRQSSAVSKTASGALLFASPLERRVRHVEFLETLVSAPDGSISYPVAFRSW